MLKQAFRSKKVPDAFFIVNERRHLITLFEKVSLVHAQISRFEFDLFSSSFEFKFLNEKTVTLFYVRRANSAKNLINFN